MAGGASCPQLATSLICESHYNNYKVLINNTDTIFNSKNNCIYTYV